MNSELFEVHDQTVFKKVKQNDQGRIFEFTQLESTCHSLESTHISKRNRLKGNLITLLMVNGIVSTLVNSELFRVNSNIQP